jgi:hypothetical protein
MASDFSRILDNVQKMVDQEAPISDINGYLSTEGYSPAEFKRANENFGTFTSSVKRGAKGIGSLLADVAPAMGGYIGEQIGIPGAKAYKERQMAEAAQTQEEIAKFLPAKYESYQDVSTPLEAFGYAKEAIGEAIPSILPSVVTGGAAGVLGRGAVAKAGQIASEQAKKKVLDAATPEELVSGLATQQAAKSGSLAATQAMARKQLGQEALGAFAGSVPLNVPEAFQSIYSETGQEQLLPALASGGFNAVLDAITPLSLLRTAKGKGISNRDIVGAWYARGAKELGKGVLTEGATEALQEMTNAAAVSFVDENKEFFTPENLTRFIDAGLKGGIGGGAIQSAFGVAFGKQAPKAAAPLPPTPGPGPLTPAQAGATPIVAEAPQTPLKTTGEAGPISAAERDLFGGVVPGTQLAAPSENMRPILDESGKVIGYEPVARLEATPELTGEQLSLQAAQDDLFAGQPSVQPTPTPEPPLVNEQGQPIGPEPVKPVPDLVKDVVTEAKQDPSASKLLKANNPATAKLVTTRIEELVEAAGGDPVLAMEQLYENNRKGQGKALTPAQQELLDVAYRRATGRQIEDAIKERAFIGAEQGDLFADTAPAKPAPAPVVAGNPETVWGEHKNDDHPAYADLNPEEKSLWDNYVSRGTSGASAFQDVTRTYEERMAREKKKTTEEVKQIFEEEKKITAKDVEPEIAGKTYNQLLDYLITNGPESISKIMERVATAVTRMKGIGYTFSFDLSQSPQQSARFGLGRNAAGHVWPKGNHMELVLAGRNSGRPFGATLEVVGHELLHSVTIPLIRYGEENPNTREGKVVQELKDLSAHVKKEVLKRVRNGTATPMEIAYSRGSNLFGKKTRGFGTIHIADEIMSWGNTNSDVRTILESIPYKGTNVISAFVEIIRKLIGLSPKESTALSELIRLTDEVFNFNIPGPTSRYGKKLGIEVAAAESAAFKKWFGDSKIVDENGEPLVVYHGTTKDFSEFKKGLIFVSPNALVANKFAADDMLYSPESTYVTPGANVMPVYVKSDKPFDYENPQQVDILFEKIKSIFAKESREAAKKLLSEGNFKLTEDSRVIDAIKSLGYDGVYVQEFGAKNLAVFESNQIKSAIGNIGTYSPDIADIVSSERSTPWSERETPNQFGREAALTAMHNKMQSAYDESFSPDEAFDAAYAQATKEEQYILRQLKNDEMLGFDYPHQAIQAIIEEPTAFDLAPQLKTAISKMGNKFVEDPTAGTSQIPLDAQYDSQVSSVATPAPAPGPSVVPAPGQPYTLPNLTKLQPSPTAGQQVKNVTQKITNAWNDDGFWTRFRIAAVDPTAGLAKTLRSLPLFQDGQLRADMLIRSFNQVINLIKNGLQSGIPVVNADGTVIIRQDANNQARAQVLADELDSNPIVKGSGLSGRGFIAEITRIKRGEEIMAEDARLRAKGALMMEEAKSKMAQARQLRASNAPMGDIIKLINQAKALRREGAKIKDINREIQVTQAHIDWANAQIKAVPETQAVFDIFRAINVGLIDVWESVGLLTPAEAANYRQKTFYVPLYAAREDLAFDDQEAYTGKGTGTKTVRLLDRLEGADIQRNIWENMDKHYASMTAAAFQNQTRRVAVEQLQTVGAARISTTDDNPAVNLRYKDPSHPNANQHGVVSVILDNPNDLAAFQMMHYELGPLMKGLSATTQALRATALINPMYWIRQLIRDPIHASIVAGTGIVTPYHSAKEYINILANNSEEALLLARRGVIGQIDSTIDLVDFLKQVGTEKLNPTKLDQLIRKVMRMHEASDAATRVAIYKKAKAEGLLKGMSEAQATDYGVFKSRESINFAVRGNSKTLNALRHMIPFFSAAITGLDTLYRAASGYGLNPEEKKAAQQLFIKRAGMMAMLSAAYAMMLQDDEDYQKLPDNVKDNNWLLPNPFGGGGSFIKVSIPYEVGFLFKTVPEVAVRYMAGTSTGKEVLASYRSGLQRNLPGEGILIPQGAKPALEAITNYSFFTGRGIEGMSDQGLPVAQRGPNASEVAKVLSKAGLDKLGISPAKFDHLMQGYFAELGTFSTGMAGSAIAAATGKEPPAKNIEQMPFFKAFMTNPNTSKAATDFYEITGAAQETVNAFNRMKKEGRIQEAQEFLSDEDRRKLVSIAPAMRKVQDNMAKIRARVNQINAAKGMDPETKRVQINKLMEMYDRTARQGYTITEKAGISR